DLTVGHFVVVRLDVNVPVAELRCLEEAEHRDKDQAKPVQPGSPAFTSPVVAAEGIREEWCFLNRVEQQDVGERCDDGECNDLVSGNGHQKPPLTSLDQGPVAPLRHVPRACDPWLQAHCGLVPRTRIVPKITYQSCLTTPRRRVNFVT